MMVHVKKNFGVSLNDKDKLDKWTKCQAVIDYGGKIAFMVLCNCVNTFWSGSVKLPRHPNLENISKYKLKKYVHFCQGFVMNKK